MAIWQVALGADNFRPLMRTVLRQLLYAKSDAKCPAEPEFELGENHTASFFQVWWSWRLQRPIARDKEQYVVNAPDLTGLYELAREQQVLARIRFNGAVDRALDRNEAVRAEFAEQNLALAAEGRSGDQIAYCAKVVQLPIHEQEPLLEYMRDEMVWIIIGAILLRLLEQGLVIYGPEKAVANLEELVAAADQWQRALAVVENYCDVLDAYYEEWSHSSNDTFARINEYITRLVGDEAPGVDD